MDEQNNPEILIIQNNKIDRKLLTVPYVQYNRWSNYKNKYIVGVIDTMNENSLNGAKKILANDFCLFDTADGSNLLKKPFTIVYCKDLECKYKLSTHIS